MNAIILNGSARGEKGLTAKLADSFRQGLIEGGAKASVFNIKKMDISPCRGCLSCMHKTCGECIIKDDMQILYRAMQSSELMVVATPVYTDNMSAQMKTVIDRCMCCMSPFLRKDSEGRVRHEYNWRMPKNFFLISTCAFPEPETFRPLVMTYWAQVDNFSSASAGEICIPGSLALITRPSLLEDRLELIKQCGRTVASGNTPDENMLKELNSPLVSTEEYLEVCKKYEDWCRKNMST